MDVNSTRRLGEKEATRLAKLALKDAKDQWGCGWGRISPDMQRDTVMARVLSIVCGWGDIEKIPCTCAEEIREAANKLLED